MKRLEMLLVQLGEECAEVIQRVSKCVRFGLEEIQEGQDRTNRQRLSDEMIDVFATIVLLEEEGLLLHLCLEDHERYKEKQLKIKRWLEYSKAQGTLDE